MTDRSNLWSRIEGKGAVVVVAEVGVNHDGSVDVAHRLIDVAARCGADVVKFQTFSAKALVAKNAPSAEYQTRTTGAQRQADFISDLALPDECWIDLCDHANGVGLEFLSTPFDLDSAELLMSIGMSMVKVPSGELTNLPFIRKLASFGRPLLISTGMSNLDEVRAAHEVAGLARAHCFLHCVSSYPAELSACNLRALDTLRRTFAVPVGWSDHTVGIETGVIAVSLGASVIEKHLTLDRTRTGPDHAASADPNMFREYVSSIRRTEIALGDGVKSVHPSELDVRAVARRSWHATKDLQIGDVIVDGDIEALRPGTGISPSTRIVGARIVRPVAAGHLITEDDIEG